MPIYEYKCDKCGKQFEVLTVSMNEKANPVCPKCKSKKTSRLMSNFGRGKYTQALRSGATVSSGSAASSGCSSCSSSNCSSCGH